MSNKHFYERSKFSEFKSNTTYHQLLEMTDDEFVCSELVYKAYLSDKTKAGLEYNLSNFTTRLLG